MDYTEEMYGTIERLPTQQSSVTNSFPAILDTEASGQGTRPPAGIPSSQGLVPPTQHIQETVDMYTLRATANPYIHRPSVGQYRAHNQIRYFIHY